MKKRGASFVCVCLGMVAMLGAVVSFPLSAAHALAMAVAPASDHVMPSHAMPSHEGMAQPGQTQAGASHEDCQKPCPNCPPKGCPDVNACLAKCFQPMAQPVATIAPPIAVAVQQMTQRASLVDSGAVVSPLLRPPKA